MWAAAVTALVWGTAIVFNLRANSGPGVTSAPASVQDDVAFVGLVAVTFTVLFIVFAGAAGIRRRRMR